MGGQLGLFFFLAQLGGCRCNALRHLTAPRLQALGHLVQPLLQVLQGIARQHLFAHRQLTVADALNHAGHPHDGSHHAAANQDRERATKQKATQGDGNAGRQHVTLAPVARIARKFHDHVSEQLRHHVHASPGALW